MKVESKKIYKGCAEVRDHKARWCIQNNEPLIIEHNGKTMTLSPQELKEKIVSKSQIQKSKIGGRDYMLIGYEWKPDSVTS